MARGIWPILQQEMIEWFSVRCTRMMNRYFSPWRESHYENLQIRGINVYFCHIKAFWLHWWRHFKMIKNQNVWKDTSSYLECSIKGYKSTACMFQISHLSSTFLFPVTTRDRIVSVARWAFQAECDFFLFCKRILYGGVNFLPKKTAGVRLHQKDPQYFKQAPGAQKGN